jgi:NADH dehydrogenase
VVQELLGRGHAVRALVRDGKKAARELPGSPKLRVVEGDVASSDALRTLLDGGWACINCIGILREAGGQTFQKMHVGATRNLVRAAGEAGARRFVQISALGVTDEHPAPYLRSKHDAEQLVRRSGLDWTVLRPGMIHGPDGEFIRMAASWARGEKQPWFFLPYFTRGELSSDAPLAAINRIDPSVQPVAVEDVACCAAEALERDEAIGEIYNLAGPEVLTWPEMLRLIRDRVPGANASLEPRGIPAEVAAGAAVAASKLGIGALLPFDAGMAVMGSQDATAMTDKARAHLGFRPRPFRATFESYASRL